MWRSSPRTVQPTSSNKKKTRRKEIPGTANELVGAKGMAKPRITHSVLDHGFHTDKYKTYYSAWTPVINSASNGQIFLERLDLIAHWAKKYGQFADLNGGVAKESKEEKDHRIRKGKERLYYKEETRRPPWLVTDPYPSDLQNAAKALLYGHNPNQPCSPESVRVQRLGLSIRTLHKRSLTAPAHMRIGKAQEDYAHLEYLDANGNITAEGKEPVAPSKLTLTEALAMESYVDETEVERPWPKSISTSPVRRQDLTIGVHPSGHDSMLTFRCSQDHRSIANPTVLFISSEIPACELLLESVMFGVIAIPYEYEGSTLDSLLEKMRLALQGRQAKCIGIFAWGDSGTVRLVRGETLSVSTVNKPQMRFFWESICTSVLARMAGGRVDIFIPLIETEQGMDVLVQLGLLTDMQFSCPTGMTGSFARVESDWLYVPNDVTPPALYFNITKLGAWSTTVDYIEECVNEVKANLKSFFLEEQRNLAKRLVGQITFEALGMCNVYRLLELAPLLVDAIVSLEARSSMDSMNDDPVQLLIDSLQTCQKQRIKSRKTPKRKVTHDEAEVDDVADDNEFLRSATEETSIKPGLSAGEKRTMLAHEILSTEVTYMRSLFIIQDVFKKPLNAALASNRAILSSANLQTLFADTDTLLALSSSLVNDLSNRLDEWDSHQTLGDVFFKFTTQLRAYTNFLNNYPVTLQTLERCREHNPHFRLFLGRHEKQPNTKMLSLPELLLLPGRRIKSYVELLESFMTYTPSDHIDRNNLTVVIRKLKDLDCLFRQYQERLDREKSLKDLQKRIVNCPALAERSRHFICEENVIILSSPNTGKEVKPEFRVYQQTGDIGLFLFNDSLLLSTLTFKFLPFKRLIQRNYKFQACISLNRLKVENLADSKYVKNAFTIVSPKRMWICQAQSWDQKHQWISVLESCISAAVEMS